MRRFKNILVTVDTRYDYHAVLAHAAKFALLNKSKLTIVDVMPEMSWLARSLVSDSDYMLDLLEQEKKGKLDEWAQSFIKQGIDVETEILSGKTSIELIKKARRGDFDLLFAPAKGKNSKRTGHFGQTAMQLMRKCPCPVWLVPENAEAKLKHILGCVDTSSNEALDIELNQSIYELCVQLGRADQAKCSLAHAWSIWNEWALRDHLNEESYQRQLDAHEESARNSIKEFLDRRDDEMIQENIYVVKGEPHQVIPKVVTENEVDLVVMGTVARSGLSGMLMGNTAEHILDHLNCTVLTLKPASFRCPVALTDSANALA